jgi:hypothetical protein
LKVVCCRTAGSRHGSNKRGTPGWGSPYASEPLSSVSGCQQGSSDQLARYQTKYGQHNVQFREAFPCVRVDDPARTTHRRRAHAQCSVSKTDIRCLISHCDGLIVVRPGGGFNSFAPGQHVEMSRRRIRETLGPGPNRFDSIVVKL